jgi:UDP:flavonoid glycosyltransferase YjiC (YdhE family)
MRLIDEHWIAYPQFIAGPLGFFERLKLKMAGRPTVRYLDVILSRADPEQRGAVLSRAGCDAGTYVLVVPGGGTGHPGADEAVGHFMAAARALAARGVATVYVGPTVAGTGAGTGAVDAERHWHPLGPLPQAELAELMRSARLIVANGGSTLLQAIVCGSACIAVPIAKDQFERTRRCVAAGVAVSAVCDAASIVQAADGLLQDEPQRAALAGRAARLQLADGVDVAMQALGGLLESASRAAPPRRITGAEG